MRNVHPLRSRVALLLLLSALAFFPPAVPPSRAASCSPTLSMVVRQPSVANGSEAAFDLAVGNAGTGTCSEMRLSLYYPPRLAYASSNPAATAGGYYWLFASMAPRQSVPVTLRTTARANGKLPQNARLEGCLNAGNTDKCVSATVKIVASSVPTPTPTALPSPTPSPSPTATPKPSPSTTPTAKPTPTPASNLLSNPGFETPAAGGTSPAGWTAARSGNNAASFSYLSSGAHGGNRAVRVDMTRYVSGSAFWRPIAQPVTAGRIYEYQDYYRSSINSEIDVEYEMQDGSTAYGYVGTAAASPDWNRFYAQFTPPAGAVTATVYHSAYAVGWFVLDDVALSEYRPVGFARGMVSLTFDDPITTNGLPLLNRYGFKSTQYIVTGFVDTPENPDVMSPSDIASMARAGHEIASHSVSHPFLVQIDPAQQEDELAESREQLEEWTGMRVTSFAAPYGEVNERLVPLIADYYSSNRGVDRGYNGKDGFDPYRIRVQNMFSTTTISEFRGWLARARADRTWLVLVYHQVNPDPAAGTYNTYPDDFAAQLEAIADSGLPVMTVRDALSEIRPQL